MAREVFGAPGAAPLFSSRLIAAIAPDGEVFDADMFMYGEDIDFDWRARRAGLAMLVCSRSDSLSPGQPGARLRRVEALANRYLSVIKNAYLR